MKHSCLLASSLALVLFAHAPVAQAQLSCSTAPNVASYTRELQSMLFSHLRMRPIHEQELRSDFARSRTRPDAAQVQAKLKQIVADPKTVELGVQYDAAKVNLDPALQDAVRIAPADLVRSCPQLERAYALAKAEEDVRNKYIGALREALK